MSKVELNNEQSDNSEAEAAAAKRGEDVSIKTGENGLENSDSWITPDNAEGDQSDKGDDQQAAERPDWIPEKFWTGSLEDSSKKLAESYAKLEAGRGDEQDTDKSDDEDGSGNESDDASGSAVERAMAEFDESGELNEKTYEALEAEGLARETVDAYITGVRAQQKLAHVAAGGEEQFQAMSEWASEMLTETELKAYNEAVSSNDPDQIVEAVQGLSSRYQAERTTEPDLVSGNRANTQLEGFRSRAEMVTAMSDPRYSTDEAYRADVMKKIAAAEKNGVNIFT